MKASVILYLILFVAVILWITTQTPVFNLVSEGYEDSPISSEPTIAKGVNPTSLPMAAQPNPAVPGSIPFAPYAQTAAIGSYQYQDPALLPASLQQMSQLREDLKTFLVFEGADISSSSDPTVQLPLTQIRADQRKLDQEISVLQNNEGIQSQLTQQDITDMQSALSFLKKKVRLLQNSGVISEGFSDIKSSVKTRATKADLQDVQTKIYAAILALSASATTDPVVTARIKALQSMYSSTTDMINKVDQGIWMASDIPVYKEDIADLLPNLAKTGNSITDIFKQIQKSGKEYSPLEKQLVALVGEKNVDTVFGNLQDKGMFRVNVDLGYNVPGTNNQMNMSQSYAMNKDGSIKSTGSDYSITGDSTYNQGSATTTNGPFDQTMPGADDSQVSTSAKNPGTLDWKKRVSQISEQIRLRGLDPQDFGCIPEGSMMSPAYSWRGHARMICGRLGSTLDPGLPESCGCPPPGWKGWTV